MSKYQPVTKPIPVKVNSKNGGSRPDYIIFMPDQVSMKEDGYHVACLAPRGDTFAPTVTELSLNEYGFLETPDYMPGFAGKFGTPTEPKEDIWSHCPPDDKPWVLFLPLVFPHCPFQVEEPYFSMYDRKSMKEVVSRHEHKTGYELKYMKANRDRYRTERATDEIWKEIKATYYGMITRLDDQFGRLLNKVDELGLWKDTVTMFFTDHGEYLGDHGMIEKWPSGLGETIVHEPLIIGGAGLPEGNTISAMTEMVDLVPTVFELSGIAETFMHNGKSWVPLLIGGETKHKGYAFSEGGFLLSEEPLLEQAPYPYDIKTALQHEDTTLVGKEISLRDKDYYYVYRLYEPAELYDRHKDLPEMHNLAELREYAAIVSKRSSLPTD
ncbi:hypothetical protein V2G26_021462 [Clonostachys chloroleuca]